MKANEMPERIYIFDYNDAMVTPLEGDTTYVREDAFIEKAKMWMLTHTYMFQSMEEVDLYIEMFIKEMKGE